MNNYWKRRIDEAIQRTYDTTQSDIDKQEKQLYERITKRITEEFEKLYFKILEEDELTRTEIWTYKRYREFLKEVQRNINYLGKEEVKLLNNKLEEALRGVYRETPIPKQLKTDEIPESRLRQILNSKWSGEHFSSRVWKNKDKLYKVLRKSIEDSVLLGYSKDKAVKNIMDTLGASFRVSDRLVRTELMHVLNEGSRQKYIKYGYKKGIVLVAKDDRLCEECKAYSDNEKVRPIENIVLPVHPNCRCTVLPLIE